MSLGAPKLMTPDEFLLWCLDQEERYELVEGVPVKMMTGASNVHDRIVSNIIVSLGNQLRGTPCWPATADTAVRTRLRSVRRPDVTVTCDTPRLDRYDAQEAKLIVEVLSPSNIGGAWHRKLNEYMRREGLVYLLLVESGKVFATLFTRGPDGFEDSEADALSGVIDLPEIGCRLAMADIYDGITFDAAITGA